MLAFSNVAFLCCIPFFPGVQSGDFRSNLRWGVFDVVDLNQWTVQCASPDASFAGTKRVATSAAAASPTMSA